MRSPDSGVTILEHIPWQGDPARSSVRQHLYRLSMRVIPKWMPRRGLIRIGGRRSGVYSFVPNQVVSVPGDDEGERRAFCSSSTWSGTNSSRRETAGSPIL